jgi:hypothetical protein
VADGIDPITGYPIDTSPGTTNGVSYDPITGAVVNTAAGTPGIGWGTPGAWGQFLTDLEQGNPGSALSGILSGNYGGALGQLGAFGLLGTALNKMAGQQSQQPVGYQGGIPQYTATREQMPYQTGQQNELLRLKQAAQDAMTTGASQDKVREAALRTYGISPTQFDQAMKTEGTYRRPGQGGITYFSPIQYKASSGIAALPGNQADTGRSVGDQVERRTALGVKRTSTPQQAAVDLGKYKVGSPERAAFEQSLRSQMSEEDFKALQANPNSVLSPTFGAALQANLAGQQELARRGMSSVFGSTFSGDAKAIDPFLTALEIERPMGGQITDNRDLNALLNEYMTSALAGNTSRAQGAFARMNTLGLSSDSIRGMVNTLDPEFNDKIYNMNFDPVTKTAKGPLGYQGFESYFAPGGGGSGWNMIALDKARYGYTDEDIAYGLGMSVKDVQDALKSVPENYKTQPQGAASGGYMPGGIAMLAKGRYLKGNGDGVSDSIPARFDGSGQEARLADGEFVIPARVVSEIGNGSSDAGARKLYAMLDRVEARAKKSKRGKPSGADRELNKLA